VWNPKKKKNRSGGSHAPRRMRHSQKSKREKQTTKSMLLNGEGKQNIGKPNVGAGGRVRKQRVERDEDANEEKEVRNE